MLKISKSLIPILVCSLAGSVFAGPDWDEGAKDAGSTPATSQPVSAPQPRVITKIRGTTSVALVGVSDLVDMYLIKTGNAESLNTFIVQLNSEGTPWNARLSLFKKVSVSCDGFTSVLARPIATVVKYSSTYPYPVFSGSTVLAGSTSGATLSSLLQTNTEYFLAVSGANYSAYGDTTNLAPCVAVGTQKELFLSSTSANTFGIYPAASPAYPTTARFNEWRIVPEASGTSFAGVYVMPAISINAVPASSCGAAYPISGNPASSNFDMQFAPIIYSVGGIKISCAGEKFVTRQFYFDWNAQCSGQATISTCGSANGFDCAIQVFPLDVCSDDACSAADGCSLSCNDNCSSSIYGGSKVTFTAEAGRKYLVRLMALGDGSSSGWSLGSISFSCINANSNCCSPNWGQTCCSNSSCCVLVCEVDPYCCTTEWDQICANRALGNCPSCGGTTPFSADINNDGLVNGLDLSILLGQWGTSGF